MKSFLKEQWLKSFLKNNDDIIPKGMMIEIIPFGNDIEIIL